MYFFGFNELRRALFLLLALDRYPLIAFFGAFGTFCIPLTGVSQHRISFLARDAKVHFFSKCDPTMRFVHISFGLSVPEALSLLPSPAPRTPLIGIFCTPARALPASPRLARLAASPRAALQSRTQSACVCVGAAMAGHIGYNRSISPCPSAPPYLTGPVWMHLRTR